MRGVIAGAILTALLLGGSGLALAAQDAPAAQPEMAEVVIGAYAFDFDTREPLQLFPLARTTNGEGAFVTYHVAAQLPDGSVTGLTPCDDIAVICAPIISPAKGGLRLADAGDALGLAGEGD